MAVESAADLAVFFDADAFARAAVYIAKSGVLSNVTVILDEPVDEAALGARGVSRRRRSVQLRASEIAEPAAGDVVQLDGAEYQVRSAELDIAGAVWTVQLGGA